MLAETARMNSRKIALLIISYRKQWDIIDLSWYLSWYSIRNIPVNLHICINGDLPVGNANYFGLESIENWVNYKGNIRFSILVNYFSYTSQLTSAQWTVLFGFLFCISNCSDACKAIRSFSIACLEWEAGHCEIVEVCEGGSDFSEEIGSCSG